MATDVSMSAALPAGYTLDSASAQPSASVSSAIPAGYTIDPPAPSFMDRLKSDYSNRVAQGQAAADAYVSGQQDPISTNLQFAGKIGAGTANDAVGEVLKSATPQFVKDAGSDVLNYLGNTSLGGAARNLAGQASQAYQYFAQNHPTIAGDAESVADIGGLLAAGKSIAGAAPVVADAASTALPVVQKAGQLALDARPALGDDQKILQDLGVRLTSGQRAGGIVQSAENKATSIPITGDAIQGAYNRSFDDFNRGVTNDALASVGTSLPNNVATGHDALSFAQDAIGNSYDDVLPKMTGTIADPQFKSDAAAALQPADLLPDAQASQVKAIIGDAIAPRVDPATGQIAGQDNKEIMRRLNFDASRFSKSLDPDHQAMGDIIGNVKQAYSDMLQRNNAPELSQKLQATDLAFAKFVRLQKAGVSAANNGGVFSPSQLMQAVRSSDGSVRKGAVATGDALLQRSALAGQRVLPSKTGDSGTFTRAALATGLASTAALNPAPLMSALAGAALYTRPAQSVLRGISSIVRK